jgi:catechol 2,3-dioxygenase-like lactoylglutathione lyase family enzyme
MKVHLNLATRDLAESVAFYSVLLDAQPAKRLADYALFVTERPGLELALDLDPASRVGGGQHFGLAVDSVEAVETSAARLAGAGYRIEVEREETCCYAVQSKVWASDPEGRRWETYVVHAESDARDACCP